MIGQRAQGLLKIQLFCQVCLAAAIFIAMFLGMELAVGRLSDEVRERYPIYLTLVMGTLLVAGIPALPNDIATSAVEFSALHKGSLAARQTILVAGVLFLFLVATKDAAISRIFLFSYIAVLYPALAISHFLLPRFLAKLIFHDSRVDQTLLVGRASVAKNLEGWLELKRHIGFRVVGLLSNSVHDTVLKVPRLGDFSQLDEVLARHQITQVILLGFKDTPVDMVIEACEKSGVRLLIYNDIGDQLHRPLVQFRDDGKYFAALRTEPLENPFNRALKRAFDLLVSVPMVVVVLPLLAVLVWALQRLQSPGPLFHRQIRSGLQQTEFQILKFRTMHDGVTNQAQQASRGDPRVFPAGRWLRRYSLDEFPQFLNVLKGEMSVIGPRPHLVVHNEKFAKALAHYHGRTWVKPGITGLAQVRGFRGEITSEADLAARIAADFEYIENWTLSLDLGIVVRTAWQVLMPPKSAY